MMFEKNVIKLVYKCKKNKKTKPALYVVTKCNGTVDNVFYVK